MLTPSRLAVEAGVPKGTALLVLHLARAHRFRRQDKSKQQHTAALATAVTQPAGGHSMLQLLLAFLCDASQVMWSKKRISQ
jgi:hypothetical protein